MGRKGKNKARQNETDDTRKPKQQLYGAGKGQGRNGKEIGGKERKGKRRQDKITQMIV